MAKEQAKEAEGEDAKKDGEDAAPEGGDQPKQGFVKKLLGNKKMLIIVAAALLLVVGGGGAGAYFFLFSAPKDAKTGLQEWGQARALGLPVYEMASRDGPSHAPHFVMSVSLGGEAEQGQAGTRRAAEQAAAQALLTRLRAGMKGR